MLNHLAELFRGIRKKLGELLQGFCSLGHNIRPERIKYMLIFSLAPIFPGMKNSLIVDAHPLFGLDGIYLMGISYSLGIGLLFAFVNLKHLALYARQLTMLMVGTFVLWVILPISALGTWIGIIFSFLLGGCSGLQLFGFSWGLSDCERLVGATLTTLFCLMFQIFDGIISLGNKSGLVYLTLQIVVSALCLIFYQNQDFSQQDNQINSRTRQGTFTSSVFLFCSPCNCVFLQLSAYFQLPIYEWFYRCNCAYAQSHYFGMGKVQHMALL